MKYDITGRHLDVTDALRTHVETELDKIKPAFDGKHASAHIVMEVERGRSRCDVTVNWKNDVLTAQTVDSDMYNSISLTLGKIEKQARKHKDKIIDKSHKAVKVSTLVTDDEIEA